MATTHTTTHVDATETVGYHCPHSEDRHSLLVGPPIGGDARVYLYGTWDDLADFAERLAKLVAAKRREPVEGSPTLAAQDAAA